MSYLFDRILDEYGGNRYDNYIAVICPWHQDNHPSLFIHEDTYRCVACGAWGNTENFLRDAEGHVRPHIDEEFVRNPFTMWTKEHSLSDVLKSAHKTYREYGSVYLSKERGISDEYGRRIGIGYLDGWYTFPIRNDAGHIIGGVARSGDKQSKMRYVLPKGQDPNLLYIPDWKLHTYSRHAVLVFGILDAVTLCQSGVPAMSTTGGKQLDPSSLDTWRKKIFVIPDFGEEKEGQRLAAKLGWRGWSLNLDWPDGVKDINDFLTRDEKNYDKMLEQRKLR